jgi:hypothetical protein
MIPNVNLPEGSCGPWTISKFTIGTDPEIFNLRLAMSGRGISPGKYTRLTHAERGVVMSDTPAEKRDHYSFVRAATGNVLINGLGIGMCLNALLMKDCVENVTVVEIDQDIIDLVASYYSDVRVTIIKEDALEFRPTKGVRFDAVWHDIWDSISEDNLPEMHKLHRKYGRISNWQGSWGRSIIEQQKRQSCNAWWRR